MRIAAVVGALALTALGLSAGSALAAGGRPVFVQTDGLTGNQIAVYDRSTTGVLTPAGTYATGGLGGKLEGSVVDHLAAQSSLALDRTDGLLLAVNAGSDTVSVFGVYGDRLALRQTIASGGAFPVSIAVHDGLVYVLNAEEGGSVQGYRVSGGRLAPLAESLRTLGLNPTATPQFVNTPGQVAITPSGSQLLVTTKANGSSVEVFAIDPSGRLSASPTVDPLPGEVPFAVSFDRLGHVVIAEAAGAVASFELNSSNQLVQLDTVPTEQAATCWIVRDGDRFYASNAGSASLSGFQLGAAGNLLTPIGLTTTDGGTVDATVPAGGKYLYVQTGAEGKVDEFAIAGTGALSPIGSVTVPGAVGGEGIVTP